MLYPDVCHKGLNISKTCLEQLMTTNLSELPKDLPVPVDDGATDHLMGVILPSLSLQSTDGVNVNLGRLPGRCVIYIYPMTGQPGVPLPDGWDAIPGARGCTPQSCSFRDHHAELGALGAKVFGLSTQTTPYQMELRNRLHLPFELLSDSALLLKGALKLPTFSAAGMDLYKRLTLIVKNGQIEKVFYPIFPSDRNAGDVIAWLRAN
jgi:peroxiredoxin